MNSAFRSIDLGTYILAPVLVGQLMTFLSPVAAAAFMAGWNLVSLAAEYCLLRRVYRSVPQLARPKATGDAGLRPVERRGLKQKEPELRQIEQLERQETQEQLERQETQLLKLTEQQERTELLSPEESVVRTAGGPTEGANGAAVVTGQMVRSGTEGGRRQPEASHRDR